MSVGVMAAVWKLDLPDSDKIVLLALADCANDEGHCWPGMKSLVRKCSKTDRTIQWAIKRLVDEGHLTRREVPGKGCNYTVHPRIDFTPEAASPPKGIAQTPEVASDKPSRTTISEAKASETRVIESWNDGGLLIPCLGFDASRSQMFRLRLKTYGLDKMLEAVRRAKASAFLRGEKGDCRKADINIILQPKTLNRVLEGFYGVDEKRLLTPEQQRAAHLREAAFFERHSKLLEANECRRLAAEITARIDGEDAQPAGSVAQKIMEGVRLQ